MSEFAATDSAPKILGLAASLRNGLPSSKAESFCEQLSEIPDSAQLRTFLEPTATRSLSNSEIALAAGLWAAAQSGSKIELLRLGDFFASGGGTRHIEKLGDSLQTADGIVLSSPVYFGDRSSLAGELLDFLGRDHLLRTELRQKVAGGIAVGAKRNGGQETTLIYQLADLMQVGLLGVGNDSDTTAQYGGTCHAGDRGTLTNDEYGLWTAQGTGRRVAHIAGLLQLGRKSSLRGKLRVLLLVMQDYNGIAADFAASLAGVHADACDFTLLNLTEKHLSRCLACDTCPTKIDLDRNYTCKVTNTRCDEMMVLHETLLNQDAIIPIVYSGDVQQQISSNYQRFLERSRYLRRGDYLFSDHLVAPLVIEELGARQHYDLRMLTSWVRHHTVMSAALVAHRHDNLFLNRKEIETNFALVLERTRLLTAGRLSMFSNGSFPGVTRYNPVGYVLRNSEQNDRELLAARDAKVAERHARLSADAMNRLAVEESANV